MTTSALFRLVICAVTVVGALATSTAKTTLASRQFPAQINVTTPLGGSSAVGVLSGDTYRFIVKYGIAGRWAASSLVTTWQLPNGLADPAGAPLACPQDGLDADQYSEDCLSMVIHVPKAVVTSTSKANIPILMWVHGGSFIQGSASDPALEGSKLAAATNSIVVVVQYRLGGFGWLSPNGASNLGLKDIVTALQFVNKVITSFGGDNGQVVLAGQSAGATVIRALLAVPAAKSLFKSAILQSDPMDYGFYKPSAQATLNDDFLSYLGCVASDSACLSALSVQDILDASDNTFFDGLIGNLDPSVGGGEVFRPVRDGTFLTSPLDSTAAFPKQSRPILLTTVTNEATPTIYGSVDLDPVPPADFESKVGAAYTENSTQTLINSAFYKIPPSTAQDADIRPTLQVMGTDGIWRCPTWSFARMYSNAGGKVYVGEIVVGATYPTNADVSQCLAPGAVCHQDDIQILFGTVSSPTALQNAATAELQARWGAFVRTGNPNASGYLTWASSSPDVKAIPLGNKSLTTVDTGACMASFWGNAVPYDYQRYDI